MKKPKKRKVPPKYTDGLSAAEKKKREAELRRRMASKAPDYSPLATDFDASGKRRKTKTSKHTTKYKKMFGRRKNAKK